MCDSWGIKKIYVLNSNHFTSYNKLKIKYSHLTIINLANIKLRSITLVYLLIKEKLLGNRIYIFHECCWPELDLLIWILKPKGFYFPQVSMDSYTLVKKTEKVKVGKLTNLYWYLNYNLYKIPDDGENNKFLFYLSIKSYPKSIKKYKIKDSRNLIKDSKNFNYAGNKDKKNIIFFADSDKVDTSKLVDKYSSLIEKCLKFNFKCFIKRHPNIEFHIPIKNSKAIELDYSIPFELMEGRFDIAIGTSSTTLINFQGKSISILQLLDGYDDYAKEIKHFFKLIEEDNKIRFPQNSSELMVELGVKE
jgi:hypothetical protein